MTCLAAEPLETAPAAVLQEALRDRFGGHARIAAIERKPLETSSHLITCRMLQKRYEELSFVRAGHRDIRFSAPAAAAMS